MMALGRSRPCGSLLLSSPWSLGWLMWAGIQCDCGDAAPVLVVATTSRKDGSQDAFVNLPLHGHLLDLWRRIIISICMIKAGSPFYSIAARDSSCETVGGGSSPLCACFPEPGLK